MHKKPRYYIVEASALPEVFLKVAQTKHLLETGCIDNYEYEMTMSDMVAGGSTCFLPGDVTIGVIQS